MNCAIPTDGQVTAHLLVPGWTTRGGTEFQQGQWSPDQVVDVLLPAVEQGHFYIICPDDDVTPEMDSKRILWSAGDVAHNRPLLSRWHGDYGEAFEKFDGEVDIVDADRTLPRDRGRAGRRRADLLRPDLFVR